MHFVRQLSKDLDYLLNLGFVHFWGLVTKVPEIMRFLDEFLQNVRKHNDIYKLQFIDVTKPIDASNRHSHVTD